jgi:hypothetical protein
MGIRDVAVAFEENLHLCKRGIEGDLGGSNVKTKSPLTPLFQRGEAAYIFQRVELPAFFNGES